MASQGRTRAKSSRRFSKKRRESEQKPPRRLSLDIPERFKDGDDAEDDVTAPKKNNTMSMNQSIFSMIARAGQHSQTDLATMQEVDSGESDSEGKRRQPYHSLDGAARLSRLSSANDFSKQAEEQQGDKNRRGKQHRRVLSEHKLLRSLPKLKSRKDARSEGQAMDQMSLSQLLPPRPPLSESPAASASELLSNTRAKATDTEDTQIAKAQSSSTRSRHGSSAGKTKSAEPLTLAQRLQQIFEFDQAEEVISEYPCWLLQSILLQGYMYITQKHICFYAYIPKKHVSAQDFLTVRFTDFPQHDVSKTGYLFKRGRSKYNRYWFILRGDVLSYYTNPAELYFPRNRINLQYAISAQILEPKKKDEEETVFTVTTDERTVQFKADSAASAKEWVRSIQKVIFRTHNEGNSVKISLPIQNVLEIEESAILDFANTVKVRVIDNDETFAIDEVSYLKARLQHIFD